MVSETRTRIGDTTIFGGAALLAQSSWFAANSCLRASFAPRPRLGGLAALSRTLRPEPLAETVQREYVAALVRVAGWRLTGDQLVLVDGEDAELLRFSEPSPVGDWKVSAFLKADFVTSLIAAPSASAERLAIMLA